jgi:hypothetical protein
MSGRLDHSFAGGADDTGYDIGQRATRGFTPQGVRTLPRDVRDPRSLLEGCVAGSDGRVRPGGRAGQRDRGLRQRLRGRSQGLLPRSQLRHIASPSWHRRRPAAPPGGAAGRTVRRRTPRRARSTRLLGPSDGPGARRHSRRPRDRAARPGQPPERVPPRVDARDDRQQPPDRHRALKRAGRDAAWVIDIADALAPVAPMADGST